MRDPDSRPDSPEEITDAMIADAVSRLDAEAMIAEVWGMTDADLLSWARDVARQLEVAMDEVRNDQENDR